MRHILYAPPKKMLSFSLDEGDLALLARVAEVWLLHCSGREIPSLQYYRKLTDTRQNLEPGKPPLPAE